MNARNREVRELRIESTPAQADVARSRLETAFLAACYKTGLSLKEAAPGLREVLDALPQLRGLWGLAVELRAPILYALVEAGAVIPRETWADLGVESMYRERGR